MKNKVLYSLRSTPQVLRNVVWVRCKLWWRGILGDVPLHYLARRAGLIVVPWSNLEVGKTLVEGPDDYIRPCRPQQSVSVTITQLFRSMRTAIDNMQTNRCGYSNKTISKNRVAWIWPMGYRVRQALVWVHFNSLWRESYQYCNSVVRPYLQRTHSKTADDWNHR